MIKGTLLLLLVAVGWTEAYRDPYADAVQHHHRHTAYRDHPLGVERSHHHVGQYGVVHVAEHLRFDNKHVNLDTFGNITVRRCWATGIELHGSAAVDFRVGTVLVGSGQWGCPDRMGEPEAFLRKIIGVWSTRPEASVVVLRTVVWSAHDCAEGSTLDMEHTVFEDLDKLPADRAPLDNYTKFQVAGSKQIDGWKEGNPSKGWNWNGKFGGGAAADDDSITVYTSGKVRFSCENCYAYVRLNWRISVKVRGEWSWNKGAHIKSKRLQLRFRPETRANLALKLTAESSHTRLFEKKVMHPKLLDWRIGSWGKIRIWMPVHVGMTVRGHWEATVEGPTLFIHHKYEFLTSGNSFTKESLSRTTNFAAPELAVAEGTIEVEPYVKVAFDLILDDTIPILYGRAEGWVKFWIYHLVKATVDLLDGSCPVSLQSWWGTDWYLRVVLRGGLAILGFNKKWTLYDKEMSRRTFLSQRNGLSRRCLSVQSSFYPVGTSTKKKAALPVSADGTELSSFIIVEAPATQGALYAVQDSPLLDYRYTHPTPMYYAVRCSPQCSVEITNRTGEAAPVVIASGPLTVKDALTFFMDPGHRFHINVKSPYVHALGIMSATVLEDSASFFAQMAGETHYFFMEVPADKAGVVFALQVFNGSVALFANTADRGATAPPAFPTVGQYHIRAGRDRSLYLTPYNGLSKVGSVVLAVVPQSAGPIHYRLTPMTVNPLRSGEVHTRTVQAPYTSQFVVEVPEGAESVKVEVAGVDVGVEVFDGRMHRVGFDRSSGKLPTTPGMLVLCVFPTKVVDGAVVSGKWRPSPIFEGSSRTFSLLVVMDIAVGDGSETELDLHPGVYYFTCPLRTEGATVDILLEQADMEEQAAMQEALSRGSPDASESTDGSQSDDNSTHSSSSGGGDVQSVEIPTGELLMIYGDIQSLVERVRVSRELPQKSEGTLVAGVRGVSVQGAPGTRSVSGAVSYTSPYWDSRFVQISCSERVQVRPDGAEHSISLPVSGVRYMHIDNPEAEPVCLQMAVKAGGAQLEVEQTDANLTRHVESFGMSDLVTESSDAAVIQSVYVAPSHLNPVTFARLSVIDDNTPAQVTLTAHQVAGGFRVSTTPESVTAHDLRVGGVTVHVTPLCGHFPSLPDILGPGAWRSSVTSDVNFVKRFLHQKPEVIVQQPNGTHARPEEVEGEVAAVSFRWAPDSNYVLSSSSEIVTLTIDASSSSSFVSPASASFVVFPPVPSVAVGRSNSDDTLAPYVVGSVIGLVVLTIVLAVALGVMFSKYRRMRTVVSTVVSRRPSEISVTSPPGVELMEGRIKSPTLLLSSDEFDEASKV